MPVINESNPLADYLAMRAQLAYQTQQAQGSEFGQYYTDPYVGMNNQQIAQKAAGGMSLQDYFNQTYAGPTTDHLGNPIYQDNLPGPWLDPSGNVRTRNYDQASDPSNMWGGLLATLPFAFAGAAAAGGSLAGAGGAGAAGAGGLEGAALTGSGIGAIGPGTALNAGLGAGIAGTGGAMDLGDWQDWGSFGNSAGTPGVGDAGAFDQWGSMNNGGVSGTGGGGSIFDANSGINWSQVSQKLGTEGAKSVLSNFLSGNQSSSDYAKLIGALGSAGLGAYASNQQSNAYTDLANKYANYGAPYRSMLAASYADPNAFLKNSPDIQAAVQQGTDATARSLSTSGNPANNPRALQEIQNYATTGLYGQLGNQRNSLANYGGLSSFNQAAPQLSAQAVGQQGSGYNALGYGVQQLTSPPQLSATDLYKALGLGGLS